MFVMLVSFVTILFLQIHYKSIGTSRGLVSMKRLLHNAFAVAVSENGVMAQNIAYYKFPVRDEFQAVRLFETVPKKCIL